MQALLLGRQGAEALAARGGAVADAPLRAQESGWSARGMGNLQLRRPLDASAGGSARLLMRNDTGKPMLNARLYAGMKVSLIQGKSVCANLFNTVQPVVAATEGGAAAEAPQSTAIPTCVPWQRVLLRYARACC